MSDRIDLFTTVHKGLRWWIGDVNAKLGASDLSDAAALEDVLSHLVDCLDALDAHSGHEDAFIAPMLDARAAVRVAMWHSEHEALDAMTLALRRQAQKLRELAPDHPRAAGLGLELYRAFARFSSEVLLHLDEEETRIMPLMWSVCTDEELVGIMSAFRARHGEDATRLYARLALAFTPAERALLGV